MATGFNLPRELLQPLYERTYNLALSDPFMPPNIKEANNAAMWKVVKREFNNQQVTSHFIRGIDRDYKSAPSTKPKVLELFHRMLGTLREGLGAVGKSADEASPFLRREIIEPMARLNAQCALDSIRGLETALNQLQRKWLKARERGGSLDVYKCFMPLQLGNLSEFTEIYSLQINEDQFPFLEAGSSKKFSQLEQLCLDNNALIQINQINRGVFDGLTNLISLDLGNTPIHTIQSGAFAALKQLRHLGLSDNQLTHINQGDFDGLINLSSLHLEGNLIQAIQSGAFAALKQLQWLLLRHNQLIHIKRGDFDGLTNLMSLELGNNQIQTIQSGAFAALEKLQRLDLNYNKLTHINQSDFDGLTNLTSLDLEGNPIQAIQSGAFAALKQLQMLDLSSNQLIHINRGDFDGLTNLKTFQIRINKVPAKEKKRLQATLQAQFPKLRINVVAVAPLREQEQGKDEGKEGK